MSVRSKSDNQGLGVPGHQHFNNNKSPLFHSPQYFVIIPLIVGGIMYAYKIIEIPMTDQEHIQYNSRKCENILSNAFGEEFVHTEYTGNNKGFVQVTSPNLPIFYREYDLPILPDNIFCAFSMYMRNKKTTHLLSLRQLFIEYNDWVYKGLHIVCTKTGKKGSLFGLEDIINMDGVVTA